MCFLLVRRACICEDFKYSLSHCLSLTHIQFVSHFLISYSLCTLSLPFSAGLFTSGLLKLQNVCFLRQTFISGQTPAILLANRHRRSNLCYECAVDFNKEVVLSVLVESTQKLRTLQKNLTQVTKTELFCLCNNFWNMPESDCCLVSLLLL